MTCYWPLKGFVNLAEGGITFKSGGGGAKMEVACGQCLGCRIDRSQEWAARIVHESSMHEFNCFMTLTYREKADCSEEQLALGLHLPEDGSLVKSHWQKFVKRLRQDFKHGKIGYYHCGEYGEQLERPHYHACFFNLDFPDKKLFKENQGNFLFVSERLEKLWAYGFCTIGELTFQSAAYCARYCMSKITGQRADDHYLRWDEYGVATWLLPEYSTMSNGIGKGWYQEFKSDVFPSDEVPVPGRGIFKKVPRYYQDFLETEDFETFEKVKLLRKEYYFAHGEDYTPERLMAKYKVKKAQVGQLTRSI